MEKHYYFDRNLLALSAHEYQPSGRHLSAGLSSRLCAARTTLGRYRFVEGKSGVQIPAWVDAAGTAHTLHSLIAPEREAEKIAASILNSEGYIIFFGLGAGFAAVAAQKILSVEKILVIDYDIDSIAELVCSKEYIELFSDPRFTLLVDADYNSIVSYITESYKPCLHNGIRVVPLRARCDFDEAHFRAASDAVRDAINRVSQDYSVQAHFGTRWFSNMLRNVVRAETQHGIIPPVRNAAVCAAGPSLDAQLETLQKKQNELFIIATDTALGSLFSAGIKPRAVISIDCQHISYLHFLNSALNSQSFKKLKDITLFLDLASPPLLAEAGGKSFFFSGGHPFAKYISTFYKKFLQLDTSGGNVSYAAISLAEKLGAKKIELYGADFAYPEGMTYTKGAYFYPYLRGRATRFAPASAQAASFLYKNPSLTKQWNEKCYYYETRSLVSYRTKIEEHAIESSSQIIPVKGLGAPVNIDIKPKQILFNNITTIFSGARAKMGAYEFLSDYKSRLESLPVPKTNIAQYNFELDNEQRIIWVTLLPVAAALKQREKITTTNILISRVKDYCINEIKRALGRH